MELGAAFQSPAQSAAAPGAGPAFSMSLPSLSLRTSPRIGVFDSGLGGLTVLRELVRARPDAAFHYVADDALFPYGQLGEEQLTARVTEVIGTLIENCSPDLIVIACNTASTIVLPTLRQRFALPFVGTVPAIKPACAASDTKRVSVLGTEGTVRREYTHALIRQFGGDCAVTLVGSPHLAAMAEAELAGDPASDAAILAEIAPCFVHDSARTDTVVLACTHYPLLLARFEAVAPWPVHWIDPAAAIARRMLDLIGPANESYPDGLASLRFTSGRIAPPALLRGFLPARNSLSADVPSLVP